MTTAGHGQPKKKKPEDAAFWLAYEKRVAALVKAIDADASITHNEMHLGELSGVPRQIDALAEGLIAGQKLRVVIEAKCYGRRVSIGTVDEFIGKLLDLGAERGILYAAGGFTQGAVARAERALNPRVGLEHLAHPLPPVIATRKKAWRVPAKRKDQDDRLAHEYGTLGREPRTKNFRRFPDISLSLDMPYEPTVPTTTSYRQFLRGEAFFYKPL
ncbi:restriction endonuclease [Streptomyces sp. NPDC086989]|uniref:restriction endonuclease n=1 Tax=Streptomyces sp. NPDC086989 TaxID=3365764 RepID=UPI0037F6522C